MIQSVKWVEVKACGLCFKLKGFPKFCFLSLLKMNYLSVLLEGWKGERVEGSWVLWFIVKQLSRSLSGWSSRWRSLPSHQDGESPQELRGLSQTSILQLLNRKAQSWFPAYETFKRDQKAFTQPHFLILKPVMNNLGGLPELAYIDNPITLKKEWPWHVVVGIILGDQIEWFYSEFYLLLMGWSHPSSV